MSSMKCIVSAAAFVLAVAWAAVYATPVRAQTSELRNSQVETVYVAPKDESCCGSLRQGPSSELVSLRTD
jgi:hypothetical protein